MTASPNEAGKATSLFEKKYDPERSGGVEIFFQKPGGPGLGALSRFLGTLSSKSQWRNKRPAKLFARTDLSAGLTAKGAIRKSDKKSLPIKVNFPVLPDSAIVGSYPYQPETAP